MLPDPSQFRQVMSRFATGITVVTGLGTDGSPQGLTVNAFASLSLDPALALVCLDKRVTCLDAFEVGKPIGINVLASDQEGVSQAFATPAIDKFEGVSWRGRHSGAPMLDGCLAGIDGVVDRRHDGGDHVIVVSRIAEMTFDPTKAPLLYFAGGYRRFGEA